MGYPAIQPLFKKFLKGGTTKKTIARAGTAADMVLRGMAIAANARKIPSLFVKGTSLKPGARKIGMGFDVPGLGTLKFDFRDLVEDG